MLPELTPAEPPVTPATGTVENPPPAQPRIDNAPRVIQLIAQAARALQDRPVDVTLDLLRRNIDMLASQLRELGYKDLSFSFAGEGEGFGSSEDHGNDRQTPAPGDPVSPDETPQFTPMQIAVTDAGGIDIRL